MEYRGQGVVQWVARLTRNVNTGWFQEQIRACRYHNQSEIN